jgi:hypothetical protein
MHREDVLHVRRETSGTAAPRAHSGQDPGRPIGPEAPCSLHSQRRPQVDDLKLKPSHICPGAHSEGVTLGPAFPGPSLWARPRLNGTRTGRIGLRRRIPSPAPAASTRAGTTSPGTTGSRTARSVADGPAHAWSAVIDCGECLSPPSHG